MALALQHRDTPATASVTPGVSHPVPVPPLPAGPFAADPLYIIPLLGVTHILGGAGLLIPNVPRLTEWVYAGLAINLLLAFYSQLYGGGSTWEKFDPILVLVFVFASYVLRRIMRANRWSM